MKNNKIWMSLVLIVLGVSLSGCDQIKSLTDSFFKKKASPNAQVQAPPSSTSPAKTAQPLSGNVLARVGDWTITIEDFKERLTALKEVAPEYDMNNIEQNKMILEELVRQQLLVQDAERSGVANKKEIAQAVEEFRRTLLVREVAAKLAENITATEEEAKTYYDENTADFTEPAQWQLREIVVEKEEDAKQILLEIMNGADFGETAKAKSVAKSSWKKGDLGLVSTFSFPKMENAVAALEVGQVSNVFKGPDGYYIVKLEDKKGGEQKAFADVKQDIINGLTMLKQQQAILNYLEQLRKNTVVEVNEKLLEG